MRIVTNNFKVIMQNPNKYVEAPSEVINSLIYLFGKRKFKASGLEINRTNNFRLNYRIINSLNNGERTDRRHYYIIFYKLYSYKL